MRYFFSKIREFICALGTYNPFFSIYGYFLIYDVRIYPQICHSKYSLCSKRCSWQHVSIVFKFHYYIFGKVWLHITHRIMLRDRIFIFRAPPNWMRALYYEPSIFECICLPFYKFLVWFIDCCKLSSPVNGISHLYHSLFYLGAKIIGNFYRLYKSFNNFFWHSIQAL